MKKEFSENKSEGKVLSFDISIDKYYGLTDKAIDKEDYIGALSFAFSGLKKEKTCQGYADIAFIYAQMGLYDLSNKFWFKYLTIAPKDETGKAYTELAINFFYLNNFALSGYYFHQKVTQDGFIDRDGLDDEIAEFFDQATSKRNLYKIVYPPERSDYSEVIKDAKTALAIGDTKRAIKMLLSVPKESKDYKESAEELAIAYLLSGDDDGAISTNKDIICSTGADLVAYCNLADIYTIKGDKEKANYYYQEGVSLGAKTDEEYFKLATCAFQQGDYLRSAECFNKVIDDKFYDSEILCLYGLALTNCTKFADAEKVLSKAYRIDTENPLLGYYANAIARYNKGEKVRGFNPPIKFTGELPKEEVEYRSKLLKDILKTSDFGVVKDDKIQEILKWGIKSGRPVTIETAVKILAFSFTKQSKEILFDILLDTKAPEKVKQIVLYVLVISGVKGKICVGANGIFMKIKVGKLLCEKDYDSGALFAGYAYAFSHLAGAGDEILERVLTSANTVYNKLKPLGIIGLYTKEEYAGLLCVLSELPFLKKQEEICDLFDIKKDRLNDLIKIVKEI